jgi:hypothetical protein
MYHQIGILSRKRRGFPRRIYGLSCRRGGRHPVARRIGVGAGMARRHGARAMPPGGPMDLPSRLLVDRLAAQTNGAFILEHRLRSARAYPSAFESLGLSDQQWRIRAFCDGRHIATRGHR